MDAYLKIDDIDGFEYTGFKNVYDITVDGNANFFLHNESFKPILVHNSGKSVFLCQLALIKILNTPLDQRLTILCTRKVGSTISNSIFKELKNVANDAGILDQFKITHRNPMSFKRGKSEIIFSGIDDPEKIKSVSRPDIIWMEEATEFDFQDFQQLNLRLRGDGFKQMWTSFNPIDQDHWLRKHIWDSDSEHVQQNIHKLVTTYKDNRFVGDEFIAEMESMKERDYNYYRIYALAEWGTKPEGLIYNTWQKYNDETDVDDPDLIAYGLDFGYNDPMALVQVKIKGKKAYIREIVYKKKYTMDRMIQVMKELGVSPNYPIYADTASPEKIDILRKAGFNVQSAVKGSIEGGIQIVKLFSLYIHEESLHLIHELNNYSWKIDRGASSREGQTVFLSEPADVHNHAADAFRYVIGTTQQSKQIGFYVPLFSKNEPSKPDTIFLG